MLSRGPKRVAFGSLRSLGQSVDPYFSHLAVFGLRWAHSEVLKALAMNLNSQRIESYLAGSLYIWPLPGVVHGAYDVKAASFTPAA